MLSCSGSWFPRTSTVQPSTHRPLLRGRAKNKQTFLCPESSTRVDWCIFCGADRQNNSSQTSTDILQHLKHAASKKNISSNVFFLCQFGPSRLQRNINVSHLVASLILNRPPFVLPTYVPFLFSIVNSKSSHNTIRRTHQKHPFIARRQRGRHVQDVF